MTKIKAKDQLKQLKTEFETFVFRDCDEEDDTAKHVGLDKTVLTALKISARDAVSTARDKDESFLTQHYALNNFQNECDPDLIIDLIDFYLYTYPELKKLIE